jgi:uncharacterized protein (TIGR01777 family)
MKIFLIGGTGFIGSILLPPLIQNGFAVTQLIPPGKTKRVSYQQVKVIQGFPLQPGRWQKSMGEHDVIINLAGTSIFQRWNKKVKDQIYNSRIRTTRNVIGGLEKHNKNIKLLFNASGIGFYGYDEKAVFDEESPPGTSFLASVARDWEGEALKAEPLGIRTVLCRFGIVMGRGGGALKNMLPLFKMFCGGKWGDGEQWFSWIHETDLKKIFFFLFENEKVNGPVNFSSPYPVQNKELVVAMRGEVRRKTIIDSIPRFLIEWLLGEFSEVFLKGQRVIPRKLIDNGYTFTFPEIKECIRDNLDNTIWES